MNKPGLVLPSHLLNKIVTSKKNHTHHVETEEEKGVKQPLLPTEGLTRGRDAARNKNSLCASKEKVQKTVTTYNLFVATSRSVSSSSCVYKIARCFGAFCSSTGLEGDDDMD